MVCCLLIGLAFALPVIIARRIFGLFGGAGFCSMAWRPGLDGVVESSLPLAGKLKPAMPVGGQGTGGFSLGNRAWSFYYAGRGAMQLLRHEHSAWIQLTFAFAAVGASIVLNISSSDWRWIVLSIGVVLCAEGLNTAIESVCDGGSLEYQEYIKTAKDVAAGAVLLVSIAAAIIGALTLLPYMRGSVIPDQVICGGYFSENFTPAAARGLL